MRRAIIYLRVSTVAQVVEGSSLAAQEAKARAWASANDISDVLVFTDAGISGSSTEKRTGLADALSTAQRGDVIVVYSLSRLARSTKDTLIISEQLAEKGVDIVSLSEKIDTTTSAGKMIFRLLAVLAEFEKDVIKDRICSSMSHLKSINRRVSRHAPYGFRFVSNAEHTTIEPDIGESTIALMAQNLRAKGFTLRVVSYQLADLGLFNRCGKPFAISLLADILKRNDNQQQTTTERA